MRSQKVRKLISYLLFRLLRLKELLTQLIKLYEFSHFYTFRFWSQFLIMIIIKFHLLKKVINCLCEQFILYLGSNETVLFYNNFAYNIV